MTENKEKRSGDDIVRADLDMILDVVVPKLQELSTDAYGEAQAALARGKSATSQTEVAANVAQTKLALTTYLASAQFVYFAALISDLMDSIDSIKQALPRSQQNEIRELEKATEKGKEAIDTHIAKRLEELFTDKAKGALYG